MSKFAVLGPGAVGGFLAGALNYRSVPVTVVADDRTSSRIRTHGLQVASETLGEFLTRPRSVDELTDAVDVLIVTTKAFELETALERIKAPVGLIMPLCSGLEHVTYLRQRFPESKVCAASIRIEAEKKATADIAHTSNFAVIDTAFDDEWLNHRELRPLVDQLRGAGIAMMVSTSEVQVLWSKIVFLNALSLISAITNMPVGWIRKDVWRAKMQAALEEGAAVAQAEGAKVSVEMTMDYVDHARYDIGTVMQRDIQTPGRPLELDAIAGSVLRAGARHGLRCETIRDLAGQVAVKAGIPGPRG